jgi:hypothetical protein
LHHQESPVTTRLRGFCLWAKRGKNALFPFLDLSHKFPICPTTFQMFHNILTSPGREHLCTPAGFP